MTPNEKRFDDTIVAIGLLAFGTREKMTPEAIREHADSLAAITFDWHRLAGAVEAIDAALFAAGEATGQIADKDWPARDPGATFTAPLTAVRQVAMLAAWAVTQKERGDALAAEVARLRDAQRYVSPAVTGAQAEPRARGLEKKR